MPAEGDDLSGSHKHLPHPNAENRADSAGHPATHCSADADHRYQLAGRDPTLMKRHMGAAAERTADDAGRAYPDDGRSIRQGRCRARGPMSSHRAGTRSPATPGHPRRPGPGFRRWVAARPRSRHGGDPSPSKRDYSAPPPPNRTTESPERHVPKKRSDCTPPNPSLERRVRRHSGAP